jgi:hypothetical protein
MKGLERISQWRQGGCEAIEGVKVKVLTEFKDSIGKRYYRDCPRNELSIVIENDFES